VARVKRAGTDVAGAGGSGSRTRRPPGRPASWSSTRTGTRSWSISMY